MSYGTKRTDLQAMAEAKLLDADVLFHAERFSSAYYLSGYALEFGLKACIAKQVAQDTIPDKSFVKDLYVHDLTKLLQLAGLGSLFTKESNENKNFSIAWGIAKDWSEQSRYETKLNGDAQSLLDAITNPQYGVMQWIRKHW